MGEVKFFVCLGRLGHDDVLGHSPKTGARIKNLSNESFAPGLVNIVLRDELPSSKTVENLRF